MEEVGLLPLSKDVDDVTMQYTPARHVKSYHLIANTILALVLLAVSLRILHKDCYTKAFWDTVSAVSFFTLIFGLCEILLRFYHCIMELTQFHTKYEGDFERVFRSLNLNTPSWIVFVLSFSTFMMLRTCAGNTEERIWSFGPLRCIAAIFISVILGKITGLTDSTLNTVLAISSMGGVDYGTGMAYSYFYGYLRIVLPARDSNIGLREKIKNFAEDNDVDIPVKKLFILIPKSGHIPPDLKEASDDWLESTTHLESVVLDRAGIPRRSYKNVVYKIHPGGYGKGNRPVYVITEGATPMLTFREILDHAHPQTEAYREHRDQIVSSFYETLQMLLNNDPGCRDVCELVLYNDKDANGKTTNVGELLLRRIRQQAATSA